MEGEPDSYKLWLREKDEAMVLDYLNRIENFQRIPVSLMFFDLSEDKPRGHLLYGKVNERGDVILSDPGRNGSPRYYTPCDQVPKYTGPPPRPPRPPSPRR